MRAKASDLSERELLESHAKALEAQVEGLRGELDVVLSKYTGLENVEAALRTALLMMKHAYENDGRPNMVMVEEALRMSPPESRSAPR